MTAIVEIKINTPDDLILLGSAIKDFEIPYTSVNSSYGHSTVSYSCTKRQMQRIREFWKETFQNCKIVSY
jgi:hypothetical protein